MKTNAKIFTHYFRVLGKMWEKNISQMFFVADLLCFGIVMHQLDKL